VEKLIQNRSHLIVRHQTLKLLEENVGKSLEDVGIGNAFLYRTPIAQKVRARIDKWYCMKLESFCTAKETIARINNYQKQLTEWERILASPSLNKRLMSRIYKELQKLNTKKISSPVYKWANELNSSEMANKCIKKCSTFFAIKEMQIKTILRSCLTPVRTAINKKANNNKYWQG
jgi:hypothetical protein